MYLGTGDLPEKYKDYDLLVCSGSLIPQHIPPSGFDQMHQAVKKGGYIVFSVRDRYYEPLGHQKKVAEMVDAGKIKFVRSYEWVKHEEMDGEKRTDAFYPEPATVFVYQRL